MGPGLCTQEPRARGLASTALRIPDRGSRHAMYMWLNGLSSRNASDSACGVHPLNLTGTRGAVVTSKPSHVPRHYPLSARLRIDWVSMRLYDAGDSRVRRSSARNPL